MNDLTIHAASYLGPEGFGNDQTGLRGWPAPLKENLAAGEMDGLHWSLLSDSDPSRFLRMDLMCRLGFMATELLAVNFDAMTAPCREHLGVCVESFTGSLDTDIRFARTPRPSIFAYTLPSTVIGEICIRHQLKGPVLSLLSPDTNGADALTEAAEWLQAGDAEMVLCLGIEAMNVSTANSISLPENLSPQGWHGAALLLGHPGNSPCEKKLVDGTLVEVCRKLCFQRTTGHTNPPTPGSVRQSSGSG
jgi:3-oxoacyl-[acyl-carrier-protein] synthase-1